MKTLVTAFYAVLPVAACALFAAGPANALSLKECSAKYAVAKTDGSLAGRSWNDFQRLECASDSAPLAPSKSTAADAAPSGPTTVTPKAKIKKTEAVKPAASKAADSHASVQSQTLPSASGHEVFPTAIAPAYAKESSGRARLHTCLDQYRANKAANANGGKEWIQKNGGYYSDCNTKLKS